MSTIALKKLAKLPNHIIEKIRLGHEGYREWSINQAIRESCRIYKASEVKSAIKRVEKWKKLIAKGVKKSEIARQEGYSRARVTQLMKLAQLSPDQIKELNNQTEVISLRGLLKSIDTFVETGHSG